MTAISKYRKVATSALPAECYADDRAKALSGEIEYRLDQEDALKRHFRLRTFFDSRRNREDVSLHAVLHSQARVTISIGCSGSSFFGIGDHASGHWDIALYDDASAIEIGNAVTSNGVSIMASNGELKVGNDCMFADGIRIHCGDNHAIVDIASGRVLNDGVGRVAIGDHVWIGSGARILKGTQIGKGSIVAAASVVTAKVFPDCCVIAGNPAQVRKTDVSWTRSHKGEGWKHVRERFGF